MARVLLIAILMMLVARAFWRVVDGILEGASTRPRRSEVRGVKLMRDPVCGTFVAPGTALTLASGGGTQYFCSEKCRAEYQKRASA